MKKRNLRLILLILLLTAVFVCYRQIDGLRTDSTPPQILVLDSQIPQMSTHDAPELLLQGVTARDDRDGDVTDALVIERIRIAGEDGQMEVRYAATDRSGNVAKVQRMVRYTDYEGPKFTLSNPLIYSRYERIDILERLGATDLLDGDVSYRIRMASLSNGTITDPGTHILHLQVGNSVGDVAEIELPIEVLAENSDNARLTLDEYLIYLDVGAQFVPEVYLAEFAFGETRTSLNGDLPRNYTLETEGQVDTQTAGIYVVDYRVICDVSHPTDSRYDQSFIGSSRLIVVVEE